MQLPCSSQGEPEPAITWNKVTAAAGAPTPPPLADTQIAARVRGSAGPYVAAQPGRPGHSPRLLSPGQSSEALVWEPRPPGRCGGFPSCFCFVFCEAQEQCVKHVRAGVLEVSGRDGGCPVRWPPRKEDLVSSAGMSLSLLVWLACPVGKGTVPGAPPPHGMPGSAPPRCARVPWHPLCPHPDPPGCRQPACVSVLAGPRRAWKHVCPVGLVVGGFDRAAPFRLWGARAQPPRAAVWEALM